MHRTDIHNHFGIIDPYWYLKGEAKKAKRKELGDRRIHSVKPVTVEDMRARVQSEGLKHVCLICDDADYLKKGADELAKIAGVSCIYWERNWENPNIPEFADGIKIHPMIEIRDATVNNLRKVMDIARARHIPVLFHSEDENLTRSRGTLLANLAEAYPEVRIVAMHAGAFGAPQFMDHPLFSPGYRDELIGLVTEMINAAVTHPNIFLETSCLAFPEKAQLLYEAARNHPELLDKIVMGSDYPLLEDHPVHKKHNKFDQLEAALKSAGFTDKDIEKFYDNVRKVTSPSPPTRELGKKQIYNCSLSREFV